MVGNVKLKHHVARRQSHIVDFGGIPRRDNHPAVIRVGFERGDEVFDLVNAVIVPVAPLRAIDGTEVAVFIRPLVPNPHAVFLQIVNVGVAFQKP